MRLAAAAVFAGLVLIPGNAIDKSASYLAARQRDDGGFAERARHSDPALTAWVVLALRASGRDPAGMTSGGRSPADYLAGKPYPTAADLALRVLGLRALGQDTSRLAQDLEALRRPNGRIGPLVNSTIWSVLALRGAGRPAGSTTIRYLLRQQRPSGGWAWYPSGAADSNDTAAAVQALRAAGIASRSPPIRRALRYLRRLQNRDGGFALVRGRASDAQSTAWAIQAFLAAGEAPGRRAYRYLARLRRRDGSYRYSARFAATPVWVTAQVLPALARQPFPLRTYSRQVRTGR